MASKRQEYYNAKDIFIKATGGANIGPQEIIKYVFSKSFKYAVCVSKAITPKNSVFFSVAVVDAEKMQLEKNLCKSFDELEDANKYINSI